MDNFFVFTSKIPNFFLPQTEEEDVKAPFLRKENVNSVMTENEFQVQAQPKELGAFSALAAPQTSGVTNPSSVFQSKASAPAPTDEVVKTAEKHLVNNEKVKKPKSKRTIDEAMRDSYPNWDKMTKEEKEQKIITHLQSIPKEEFSYLATKNQPDGRVGWLKSFLLNGRMSNDESKIVVGSLKCLNISKEEFAELQAQGVKMVFDKDNQNKEVSQLQVTKDMSKYGLKAQKVSVDETSKSEFTTVRLAGASNVSKLKDEIQTESVNKYLTNSKDMPSDFRKKLGFTFVDQYGQFAKEAELAIHKDVSNAYPDISEVAQYAASNIYKFSKENQAQAVKITIATGNEGAINAAAKQYTLCDKSVQTEIRSILGETKYESVQATLASTTPTFISSTQTSETASSISSLSGSLVDQVNQIINSKSLNSEEQIKQLLSKASESEKLTLISSLPSSALFTVFSIIIDQNPSMELLSKIASMSGKMDDKNQKLMIEKLNKNYPPALLASQCPTFDSRAQECYVRYMAETGNLEIVNADQLSGLAKDVCKDLKKEQEKKRNENGKVA